MVGAMVLWKQRVGGVGRCSRLGNPILLFVPFLLTDVVRQKGFYNMGILVGMGIKRDDTVKGTQRKKASVEKSASELTERQGHNSRVAVYCRCQFLNSALCSALLVWFFFLPLFTDTSIQSIYQRFNITLQECSAFPAPPSSGWVNT